MHASRSRSPLTALTTALVLAVAACNAAPERQQEERRAAGDKHEESKVASVDAAATPTGGRGGELAKDEAEFAPPSAMPMEEEAPMDRGTESGADDRSAESYDRIVENDFLAVTDQPLSTFSIDVDTASYSNVRRFLQDGSLPPVDAVRVEELINYFRYADPEPEDGRPFAVRTEVSACPWNEAHQLVRVGVKGKAVTEAELPPRNLVFLLDVSGSMNDPDKLPLVKRAMQLLVAELDERDRVSMVVYAGASGVVLEPTAGNEDAVILAALDRLEAGGSTNGGQGIELAYALAAQNARPGVNSRVILATDGDFNVGVSSRADLERLIEKKRESGVFLSVLGFGTGNLRDSQMEALADHGNGNYAYIDSLREARKVLVEEAGATLATIAKDVKIQVEFNPAQVASYRLVGYENRLLAAEDFNDDTKDAGEIGAGHSVMALYEVVPAGAVEASARPKVDELRYQARIGKREAQSDELMLVKLRYKAPTSDRSELMELPVQAGDTAFDQASEDLRFSAAVAAFGMKLRGSAHTGQATWDQIAAWASGARGQDEGGYRAEFSTLVEQAARLSRT